MDSKKIMRRLKKNGLAKNLTSKYVVGGIQLIATVLFSYFIFELNIIPMKYVIPLILVVFILLGVLYFIMSSGDKIEGRVSKRSIVSKIISIITSVILIFSSIYYVGRGNSFLKNIYSPDSQKSIVEVIVKKDSGYTNVNDIASKNIGISYQHETTVLNQGLQSLQLEIGTQEFKEYSTYTDLADALQDSELDAIVVGQQYREMLETNWTTFDNDTTVLTYYDFSVKTTVTTQSTDVTQNPFSVYVTGIDTYGSVSTVSRSDVNLIVTVNPNTHQILMTSIPRDCEINLHMNGSMDKLTHTGIYGTPETINTIQDFLGVKINYYARTNFTGVTNIVDALGGVDVQSVYDFSVGSYHYTIGSNHLNGAQALAFARERHSLPNGDFDRGRNQQRVLQAIINKAISPSVITNFDSILSAVEGSFQTDMSDSDIKALIRMQLSDMASWQIFNVQVAGTGYRTTQTFSMPGQSIYVMKPDATSVTRIKAAIDKMESGQVLNDNDISGL